MTALREIHSLHSVTRGTSGLHGRGSTVVQKLGLRYERKVEGAMRTLVRKLGPSAKVDFQIPLHFRDANGPGTGILDFLLLYGDMAIVGETKLKWVPEASEKLQKFYLPLVMLLLRSVRVRGLIICRSLIPEASSTPVLSSISSILGPQSESIFTFPWRGERPIVW